jgi:hypothetical protein
MPYPTFTVETDQGYTQGESGRYSDYGTGLDRRSGAATAAAEVSSGIPDTLAEEGQFCILSAYNSVDENGFLFDLTAEFRIYYGTETGIANTLETLSTKEATILCEIYPYTYSPTGDPDDLILIYSLGYNGLTDPSITFRGDDAAGASETYAIYDIDLDINEKLGIKDRFGFTGIDIQTEINSAIKTIADEVKNSFVSKRNILQRAKRPKLEVDDFSSLEFIRVSGQSVSSTARSSTAATSTGSGMGTGGGY